MMYFLDDFEICGAKCCSDILAQSSVAIKTCTPAAPSTLFCSENSVIHEKIDLINPPERSEGGLVVRDLQIWCHTLGNLYLCQRAARFIRKSAKI